jgi:tRNA-binding protein
MKVAPPKPTISMEELDKIDVRVGTIESVEDVEGADELVKLTVDLGEPERRTVLAGLKKERSNPKEIEGMQALFVVNLKPRRMRGLVSEAMLFDIGYADGVLPRLAMPEEAVPNGTRVG